MLGGLCEGTAGSARPLHHAFVIKANELIRVVRGLLVTTAALATSTAARGRGAAAGAGAAAAGLWPAGGGLVAVPDVAGAGGAGAAYGEGKALFL